MNNKRYSGHHYPTFYGCGGQKILTESPKNKPNIKIVMSVTKKETNAERKQRDI